MIVTVDTGSSIGNAGLNVLVSHLSIARGLSQTYSLRCELSIGRRRIPKSVRNHPCKLSLSN